MIIDIILALLVTYGFYTGYNRGLIDTFFDLISIVIGLIVTVKLSHILIEFLEKILPNLDSWIIYLIGLVSTFLLVMILVRFIGNKLEGLFKFVQLNVLNKVAGGILKAFLLSTVFSFLILLIGKVSVLRTEGYINAIQSSRTFKMVEPFPEYAKNAFDRVEPYFKDFYQKTNELIDDAKELEQKRTK